MFVGDPGTKSTIYNNNWKDFAPRVGFAYNVFGNGKTVVRGAYGLFYGFPEGLLYQRTDAMQPIDLYLNIPNPPQWDNVYAGFTAPGVRRSLPARPRRSFTVQIYTFITPLAGGVLNPASKVEYTQAYNLTIEQDLSHGFAMNVGYVGNHAEHVMASRQFNPAVYHPTGYTVGNENTRRIFPGPGRGGISRSYEYEMTNAVEVNVTRRADHGLTLLSNVVWMKTIDNGSSGTEGQAGPPNPVQLAKRPRRCRLRPGVALHHLSQLCPAPFQREWCRRPLCQRLAGNGILTSQGGLPITITSGVDNSISGVGNDYADLCPRRQHLAPRRSLKNQRVVQPRCLPEEPAPQRHHFGNVPRNSLRGPGFENIDVSLFKDIAPERRIHGQFQAEAFNALNHTNLANPRVIGIFKRDPWRDHRHRQQHRHGQHTFAGWHATRVAICLEGHLLGLLDCSSCPPGLLSLSAAKHRGGGPGRFEGHSCLTRNRREFSPRQHRLGNFIRPSYLKLLNGRHARYASSITRWKTPGSRGAAA